MLVLKSLDASRTSSCCSSSKNQSSRLRLVDDPKFVVEGVIRLVLCLVFDLGGVCGVAAAEVMSSFALAFDLGRSSRGVVVLLAAAEVFPSFALPLCVVS